MIASIKMQKSVKTIAQARAYIQNAWNILHKIVQKALPEDHPLVATHQTGKTAVILITSDRGLCGSYNAEVIKKLTANSLQQTALKSERLAVSRQPSADLDIIAIGKVGASYVNRYKKGNLIAEFKNFESNVTSDEINPIFKMVFDDYLTGKYSKVTVIYSHFVSSLKQIPVAKQILPIIEEHIDQPELWENGAYSQQLTANSFNSKELSAVSGKPSANLDMKFEPSAQAVVDGILKQIIRTQIFGAILEANASEHSARMVAMQSATDNATDLIDELTLVYNSIRQSNITTEIAEISAAAEAMK